MASKEESQSLIFNFSSASLKMKESAEGSQRLITRSFDSIKRGFGKRSHIKINRRHVRKRCSKKMKTASGLLTPMRCGDTFRRRLCKKVDVRYAKEMTKFINKYSYFHSNQKKCTKIEERLTRHKLECRNAPSVGISKNFREQGVSVTPSELQTKLYSAETKPPLIDIGSQTDIILNDNIDEHLKKYDLRGVTPTRNIYKEHLKNEVIDWFQHIPIFYTLDFTSDYLKENITVLLIENINNLTTTNCKESYEGLVQKQIDNCINILPMWLPNSKQEQSLFKNILKDKLYQSIKNLNSMFLETEAKIKENVNVNEIINNSVKSECELYVDENMYLKEISNWLDKLKVSKPISNEEIRNNILKRISSTLSDTIQTRRTKFNLQNKIKELIDELPMQLDYPECKNICLNQNAEDLTNRLFDIKTNDDILAKDGFMAHNNTVVTQKNAIEILGSTISNNDLKLSIYERVDKLLADAQVDNRNSVLAKIYYVTNSFESLESNIEMAGEIYDILRRRRCITHDKATSIAKQIEVIVKMGLKQNYKKEINNHLSGIISVYRSKENKFMSTPKKSGHKDIQSLSPVEKCFENLVASIRSWIETLPNSNNNDTNFKETMIYDLAGHIIDDMKSEKLSFQTDIEKDKYFNYIVNRWYTKFNIFDNINDGATFTNLLWDKLKLIFVTPNKSSEADLQTCHKNEPTTSTKFSICIDNCNKKGDTLKQKEIISENSKRNSVLKKDPGLELVEFIEEWCDKLPIEAETDAKIILKGNIAKKLYQKIGDFSVDPRIFNDENLYKDLLEDEVDTLFENMPHSPKLSKVCTNLKSQLIETILDLKKDMDQKFAGTNYKHKLETTINVSIPNPIQIHEIFDPGFEIYKNYLAKMFILDNFDHSNKDIKSKYEMRINHEIDKYFASAQRKNAIPISNEQMNNELYSVLFKVPMPNEASMINEVEEVKTRCEIDAWFESLPLEAVDNIIEMLEWDQMLTVLTKKIHDLEKNEPELDQKIRLEINKFIKKVPLYPEKKNNNNVEQFIDKLQSALKSSAEARKYVAVDGELQKGKNIVKNKNIICDKNISQMPGSSSNGTKKYGSYFSKYAVGCNHLAPKPYKCPEDQIEDIVETWCNKLPWIDEQKCSKIKNDTSTKIIIKIFEMNMDPSIFDDDIVYDQVLDEELDTIIKSLQQYCDFRQTELGRIYQLKEMIKCIKPLIKDSKNRYEYKTQLHQLVENLLNDYNETTTNLVELHELKDEIVDNFIQYNYNKNDNELKQIYKTNIHNAVMKYDSNIKKKDEQRSSLVRLNQVICELSKIPIPSEDVMKEEVEEIKMRNEVEQFFKENNLDDHSEKSMQMKKTLAKTLNDIEKSGHTELNDRKMNADITKCLNKLNKNLSSELVQNFVNNLKNNEEERKFPFKNGLENYAFRPQFLKLPYDKDENIQKDEPDFESKPSVEYRPYSPAASKDYYTRSVTQQEPNTKPHAICQNCSQSMNLPSYSTKNEFIKGNITSRFNKPWNTYRPGVINHSGSSILKSPEVAHRHKSPEVHINDEYELSIDQRTKYEGQKEFEAATSRIQSEAQLFEPSAPRLLNPESKFQKTSCVPQSLPRPWQLSEQYPSNSINYAPSAQSGRADPMTYKRGLKASRHMESLDYERHRCTCKKSKCQNQQYCLMPIEEYCDKCGGFRPRWCRVLITRCPYLNF